MSLGPIKVPPVVHPGPPAPPAPPAPPSPGNQGQVTSYAVGGWGCSFHGSGASGMRAQITLLQKHGDGSNIAWLRFFDEGQTIPEDYVQDGIIRMHMPMTALAGILELLKAVAAVGAMGIYLNGTHGTAILDYDTYASN